MVGKFKIGDRTIGENQPVFIIAEIGFLFQSFEQKGKFPGAKTLIDLAKSAGADAVKIQTFRGETIASPKAIFHMENTGRINQRKLFKQYEIDKETHAKIFRYAKQKKITIFSTPSHPNDVDLLEKFNPPAYKIGSDDLTNIPFLKYVAKKNRPIILSTGLSNYREVEKSVREVLRINKKLAILHCVSNYPMDPETANLLAIKTLEKLGVPVGWSDHAGENNLLVFAAVGLGAKIVEKHFTNTKKNPSPDAMVSAIPKSFRELVGGIRIIESALGNGRKRPTEKGKVYPENRKSVVTARKIKKGEIIELVDPYQNKIGERDIIIARPGHGLSASLCGLGLRVRFKKEVGEWQPIKREDITFLKQNHS